MGSGTDPGRTVPRSAVQEAARSDETRCHSQRFYSWLFFRFNVSQLPETRVFWDSNNFGVCLFFKIDLIDKNLPTRTNFHTKAISALLSIGINTRPIIRS